MVSNYLGEFIDQEEADWADDMLYMLERVEYYMSPQAPFRRGYSYEELIADLSEVIAEWPTVDPEALWADLRDFVGFDIPSTPLQREKLRRASKDLWSGYKKLTAKQRGHLARDQVPFVILEIRKHHGGTYRQSKTWEKKQPYVWQLLIEPQLGLGHFILTLSCTPFRDSQLQRLQESPTTVPFQLRWEKSRVGREYMKLERVKLEIKR